MNSIREISVQCAGNMHTHCQMTGCGCTVCHHQCDVCKRTCRTIYHPPSIPQVPEQFHDQDMCATCYIIAMKHAPRGQGCENCGGPAGWRRIREPGGRYLCYECRKSLGLLPLRMREPLA